MQQAKKEQEKKPDPEVLYASRILDLMKSTFKPKVEVINVLKSCDWNPESAFIILMKD